MRFSSLLSILTITCFLGVAACSPPPSDAETAKFDEKNYEQLVWEDLMPEGEDERLMEMYQSLWTMDIIEGSAADKAMQVGTFNVVEDLEGVKVRIPGFTVPFEYGRDVKINEFLLVPYFGACLHAPPPPPNQTLYVKSEDGIKMGDLAQAVWVYGTIRTARQTTDLADTAYTLELDHIEEYEY